MKTVRVIGVMSGTSLDGIDLAEITFLDTEQWKFKLGSCKTYPYSKKREEQLRVASSFSSKELKKLDIAYTTYLAEVILHFINENNLHAIDAVCTHGHTILHQPDRGITLQIGNLPELASLIKQKIVCDFRVADVQLGGQGAPLVPIGDQLLFPEYAYCVNFGGFANISFQKGNERIAFDICPVNVVLNKYALQLGQPYDAYGAFAKKGTVNDELLLQLNALDFYKIKPPKSLGIEWVNNVVIPLIDSFEISVEDKLRTFTAHVAQCIGTALGLPSNGSDKKALLTGGGVFNTFLLQELKKYTTVELVVPDKNLIAYKEALIFGLLGVLRLQNKINVLSSVTGASKNHSSGSIF
ncbi:anhydro-N-acetylmuramic acid kinase [Aquimarina agarivorans]|uniref:anhydro-N-acetylmuramic acid kinase n=1 Tax=Aquimarina agarivorans TaxID=980584 RepID=UPI000248E881|nr:anhydro-N-acetylmuramic acid kinase [Aquimarina agarivorans]